jgi:hypothetical protein
MDGSLANFDVQNNTGQEAYGFEIEIHGSMTGVGGTFNFNRYGAPQVVRFTGGVYVRYMNYQTSGCEHFGVWSPTNADSPIYRWMFADPNNPGKLIPAGTPVAIPAPVWTVLPPAKPADPPQIAVDIVAPIPPKVNETYGDAQWMKVYKTENGRMVGLDELVADNPVVPLDAAQREAESETESGRARRRQPRGGAAVRVLYVHGRVRPASHEAICADGLCNASADGEVGDFIGAQSAAENLTSRPAGR